MQKRPDIQEVLYLTKHVGVSNPKFIPYFPAYSVTNENLRNTMQCKPGKKALCVAASGDHPLFLRLYGAENITTFDITYNAKILTDIKIAALHIMDLEEYWNFVHDLHYKRISAVRNINKVMPYLDEYTREYLEVLGNKYHLFSQGVVPKDFDVKFTQQEYEKLRNIVNKPFDFIWSDIKDITLTESYDSIHLSNIFDYFKQEELVDNVLSNMMNHTNIGGNIYLCNQAGSNIPNACTKVQTQTNNWTLLHTGCNYILQRIR